MKLAKKTEELVRHDRRLQVATKLSLSEHECKKIISENPSVFRNCEDTEKFSVFLQQILISKNIKELLEEAGLNYPKQYVQNLASDWEHVFHGCETREDAIQRLKELDKIIN